MKAFLTDLDTPGGHIVTCLVLLCVGAAFWRFGVPKAEDLIVGAGAVLFAAMRGRGNEAKPSGD